MSKLMNKMKLKKRKSYLLKRNFRLKLLLLSTMTLKFRIFPWNDIEILRVRLHL